MLHRLRELLTGERSQATVVPPDEKLRLAAAALLAEAAGQDGRVEDVELASIQAILRSHFALTDAEAEELVAAGRSAAREATQLYGFVRAVNDAMAPEERVQIIEMLWEVAYADGELHDYEASLVRRVAGLLYVPDQASGAARKRVLERLQLDAGSER
ncbi:MAG: tellurite resistance TerB family protein [Rhodospirillales bacterium]